VAQFKNDLTTTTVLHGDIISPSSNLAQAQAEIEELDIQREISKGKLREYQNVQAKVLTELTLNMRNINSAPQSRLNACSSS
jgi:predicted RNA-binding protein